MKTIYKVFLVLFVVFAGFNLYAIDWKNALTNSENDKFWLCFGAAFVGLLLVFVMNSWSKIGAKNS